MLAIESGGVFETIGEFVDCFSSGARDVGISVTAVSTGGRSDGSNPFRTAAVGVTEDDGTQAGSVEDGPVWALFVCSKVPEDANNSSPSL